MENEKVEFFVVGEPRQMDNSPSSITPHVEDFIKKLKIAFPDIPVKRIDERFTSKIASQSMLLDGLKKHVSAMKYLEILQQTQSKKEFLNLFSITSSTD